MPPNEKNKKTKTSVKILTIITTVALLCAIFVIPSSAINSATNGTFTNVYTSGLPVDLYFENTVEGGATTYIPSANVYIANPNNDEYTYVNVTIDSYDEYQFSYNRAEVNHDAYDVNIRPISNIPQYLKRAVINTPFALDFSSDAIFSVSKQLRDYNFNLSMRSLVGSPFILATRYYVSIPYYNSETNKVQYITQLKTYTHQITPTYSDSLGVFNYFTPMMYTADLNNIYESSGVASDYVVIQRVVNTIQWEDGSGQHVTDYYLTDANYLDLHYDFVLDSAFQSLTPVYDNAEVIVDFDRIDTTEWLKNSVNGFLSFEIVPGLSFAGILAILFGIPLLLWFLKLFAGG